jgi:hypothetical protein
MTYAPIDDRFDEHPKYVEADWDIEHYGMQACAITYCNRNTTDGRIPEAKVRRFGRANAKKNLAVAAKLVEDGIWAKVDGGFQIVGFLDHNPSRAQVERKRAEAKARKEAWIRKRQEQDPNGVRNANGTRSGTGQERVPERVKNTFGTLPDTDSDALQTQTQTQTQSDQKPLSPAGPAPGLFPEETSGVRPKPKREPKPPSTDHQRVIQCWQQEFIRAKGIKPAIDGRTGQAAKKLLSALPVGDVCARIQAAFDDDRFLRDGAELWIVANSPNKFLPEPELEDTEPPDFGQAGGAR